MLAPASSLALTDIAASDTKLVLQLVLRKFKKKYFIIFLSSFLCDVFNEIAIKIHKNTNKTKRKILQTNRAQMLKYSIHRNTSQGLSSNALHVMKLEICERYYFLKILGFLRRHNGFQNLNSEKTRYMWTLSNMV